MRLSKRVPHPLPLPLEQAMALETNTDGPRNTFDLLLFDRCTLRSPVYIFVLFSFIFVRSFSYSSHHSFKLDKNGYTWKQMYVHGVLYCL